MRIDYNPCLSAELSERTIRALEAVEKANAAYDSLEHAVYCGESANSSKLKGIMLSVLEDIMRENARIAADSGYIELLSIGVREWCKI